MHLYALLFASLSDESARSERFRSRASEFAAPFRRWFAADDSVVPFGRSQIYRFAQGGFGTAAPTIPVGDETVAVARRQPRPDDPGTD